MDTDMSVEIVRSRENEGGKEERLRGGDREKGADQLKMAEGQGVNN